MEKTMNQQFENESVTARKFEKVCEILEQNEYDSKRLIPILQSVQEEYRYLPEKILTFVPIAARVCTFGKVNVNTSTHIL